jgi:hypothetical protein
MVTVSMITSKSARASRALVRIFCSKSEISLCRQLTQRRKAALDQSTAQGMVMPVSALKRALQ